MLTRPYQLTFALLLVALALTSTGCVRRRLTVRSNPPGAQVFVDDVDVGVTPCSTSFVYYGTRKIMVIKDGFETSTVYERVRTPWYEIPGIDFFSENVYPGEIRDERVVDVTLIPQQLVSPEVLRARGEELRASSRQGQFVAPRRNGSGFSVHETPAPQAPFGRPLDPVVAPMPVPVYREPLPDTPGAAVSPTTP